jgi:hypothetical protein
MSITDCIFCWRAVSRWLLDSKAQNYNEKGQKYHYLPPPPHLDSGDAHAGIATFAWLTIPGELLSGLNP